MEELKFALEKASMLLAKLRDEAKEKGLRDQWYWEEYLRLAGKVEGVKLALEYVRDREEI